ncbi:hypothetical protein P7C71_g4455, partial [Lecanoromycetidae sp. Uapishka_2]
MHFNSLLALSSAVVTVVAAPYSPFPLPDGFPQPNAGEVEEIEEAAQGSLPNGPLPTSVKSTGVTTLQLLATNEIFEVAYFTELIANITNNVTGYDAVALAPLDYNYVLKSLTAVVNQEQLHAAGVNGILMSAGQPAIGPCEYSFPVTNFTQAIALAQTFTDVVLGTLPQAQAAFAADAGDETPLVPLFGSVLAQEGEQVGWFRSTAQKTPSAAPFLTGGSASFAFTAIQAFIIPGSCSTPLSSINLTTFGPLNVITTGIEAKNSTIEFAVPGTVAPDTNEIVYLSGQNLPVAVPISPVTSIAGLSHFTAEFPFEATARFANGLTIAALVKGTGSSFASADEVAEATLYGPGLIEVA